MEHKKIISILVGMLLAATPVFAANPIENMILGLRAAGFQLVLLWLLTLAVVYGVLSHLSIPKAVSVRGVISIVAAFMVLVAAAGTQAANFVSSLTTASIVVAFGVILTLIVLELTGTKEILSKNTKFFGGSLVVLFILIFIGLGGLSILNLPSFALSLSDPLLAIVFFLVIMVATIWILVKESK
ncbi:MAG: hypothetical protein JW700_02310 [Candidatus Aenigmarchaeota archaeon]|nr:hypothetical protein [Candidatus Aenigmarchaeota archaeon]